MENRPPDEILNTDSDTAESEPDDDVLRHLSDEDIEEILDNIFSQVPDFDEIVQKRAENSASAEEMHEVREFIKNREEIIEDDLTPEYWYGIYEKPDIMDRFKVQLIDNGVAYAIYSLIYYLLVPGSQFLPMTFVIMYFVFVYLNIAEFINWIPLTITKGYTLGKKLYRQKVIRVDGKPLAFKNCFIRSFLMKGFCNVASFGMLNIASIIVAYVKPNSRALHDYSTNTLTVYIPKDVEEEAEERVEFS